jgi:argininosuccinate lyase
MSESKGGADIQQGTVKAWGGRFAVAPDKRVEALNASVLFDVRMVREDIRGSIAHVRMLGRQGIVPVDDAAQIESGLWDVLAEVDRGEFHLTLADEDVHTGVERRLRELIGPVTGKLHTGRSRNDQVANDFRFWTKRALIEIGHGLLAFANALVEVAEAHPTTVMPGYTHLQRAQPVLLGHHLLAYVEMTLRDLDRVRDAHRRTNVLVLGSGALAATSFPLDRPSVAADLGFARISANSLDAVGDRDFALDALFACSTIAVHLSRLSEELILWSSGEFRFIELSDAFSTGSSIMPQKKNADIAELGRGKAGRVFGDLMGLLTTLKGLPLAYNKDLQEDKEGLFDAVDTIVALLDVFPPMVKTTTFNEARLAEAALGDFTLATDAADLLAKRGLPFREAHGVVGRLVGTCIAEGKTFADLTDAEWAEIHPVFAEERPPLDGLTSASIRDVPGGPAPNRVRDALAAVKMTLKEQAAWFDGEAAAYEALFVRP